MASVVVRKTRQNPKPAEWSFHVSKIADWPRNIRPNAIKTTPQTPDTIFSADLPYRLVPLKPAHDKLQPTDVAKPVNQEENHQRQDAEFHRL